MKAFVQQNLDNIKREIERCCPDVVPGSNDYFRHYPKYKAKCFKALTPAEQKFYVDQADGWNYMGPTEEIKAAYVRRSYKFREM